MCTQFIFMFFSVMLMWGLVGEDYVCLLVIETIIQLVFKQEEKCFSNLQPWDEKSAALPTELRGQVRLWSKTAFIKCPIIFNNLTMFDTLFDNWIIA